ncbi:MAG: hypothetical protein JSW38_07470 [Dehalococcoidia bacterium]|nr:MAG: hypothetical protein JSV02_00550 [Dehalococcoidia bacterium]UCG82051.1 MAG: hypothetical protein JSW38_07470 [Dehalococcoidia bacterium]
MDNNENVPGSSLPKAKCPHHWLIDPPQGPTSMGICKLCGATREFDNQYSKSSEAVTGNGQGQKENELVNARRRQ